MYCRFSRFSVLCALLSMFSIPLFAQGIPDALRLTIPGLGANARALGMGNSYISLSDDASASYFNPAGLGLLKRLELSGGLSYSVFDNSTEFFGDTIDYSNSSTRFDRISFAFPVPVSRGSLVFGLSYQNNKDLTSALKFAGFNNTDSSMIQDLNVDTEIPFNLYLTDEDYYTPIKGNLSQSGNILTSGGINTWTFSMAMEIHKNLFFGGNFNIITGSYESNNEYYEDDVMKLYQEETAPGEPTSLDFRTFYLNRILDWDISGWDAKIGLLYQFGSFARLGFTVQFPRSFSINETFTQDASSEFAAAAYNLDTYSDYVEYDVTTPYEIGGGLSINLLGLIVSGEGTLIDYSQTEFGGAGQGLSQSLITDLNKDIKDQLRPVLNYNLGAEYTIPFIGLRVRAGVMVQPSPYKDDPKEFDRKFLTAGAGILADDTFSLDVAVIHGWWKDIGDNYGSNISRTFQDVVYNKVMLTIATRF